MTMGCKVIGFLLRSHPVQITDYYVFLTDKGLCIRRMKKNLQKSAILFGTKSNAYLQINRPIFAYSWLFWAIFAYLQIYSKSPQIYFAFRAEYSCLFLPIFRHLTCGSWYISFYSSLIELN